MHAITYSLAELEILRRLVAGVDPDACEKMVDELQAAKRIFLGGAGRSLLAIKMFAMRLMQTNHEAHLVGEVCTPSIGPGDLLVVSSGSGETGVTLNVATKARNNGARVALITANPASSIAALADVVVAIPQCRPEAATAEIGAAAFVRENQPGNLFETPCLIVCDGLIMRIMEREGLSNAVILRNHANLE